MSALVTQAVKPCPFCGGDATLNERLRDGYRFAECESCAFGLCAERTEAEAITAWNTRTEAAHRETLAVLQTAHESEVAMQARIDDLVEALERLCAYSKPTGPIGDDACANALRVIREARGAA